MNTNAVCKQIRTALYRRSGVRWSVTHGRGTACGWITIDAPKSHRIARTVERVRPGLNNTHDDRYIEVLTFPGQGYMGPVGRAKLAALLGLGRPVHHQGQDIPSSHDYYREYIDRAEGRKPKCIGKPYWD